MISLYESSGLPCWKIASFEWELHISDFEGNPSEFLEVLKSSRLECIFVAKGNYNFYFLVLEPQGVSVRRLGVGEAIFSEAPNRAYHKFADEVAFYLPKKGFRLI
jgi:hypothetical protein